MMQLHGVEVEDTFAEAFGMWGARIVVTADTPGWAEHAARSLTGFATSVIGCKCEAGIERVLDAGETPDGRPGVAVLLFAPDEEGLGKRLVERIGMTVLTCPTTACFNGLEAEDDTDVGGKLRYFGDGWQASKVLDGKRYWRIPVMEGEFLVEERFGIVEGVGGGNLIMLAEDMATALRRGGGGGRGDAVGGGRDPAVPGRHRAQRQQGRVALLGADGVDEPRAVPDAARPGRREQGPGRRRVGVRDRDRRARARAGARGDAGRARRGGASRAR